MTAESEPAETVIPFIGLPSMQTIVPLILYFGFGVFVGDGPYVGVSEMGGGRMVTVGVGVFDGLGGPGVRVEVGVELFAGVDVGVFVVGVAVWVPGVRVPEVAVGGGVGVPIGGIVGVSGGVRSGVGGGVSVGGKLIVGEGDFVFVRVGVEVPVDVGVGVAVSVREGDGEQEGTSTSKLGPVTQGTLGRGSSAANRTRASGRLASATRTDNAAPIRTASLTAVRRRDGDRSLMTLPLRDPPAPRPRGAYAGNRGFPRKKGNSDGFAKIVHTQP